MNSSDKVLQGQSGWLFLKNDTNNVLGQITGNKNFTEGDIIKWGLVLAGRKSFLDGKKAKYFFLVAPNKECVCSNYVLPRIELSKNRPIFVVEEIFDRIFGDRFIYPEMILKENVDKSFPKGDSHWNAFGAFLAYKELMSSIRNDFPEIPVLEIDDVNFIEKEIPGDLIGKINPGEKDRSLVSLIKKEKANMVYNNKCPNQGKKVIFENANAGNQTAVVFRDSFSSQLIPFLVHSFKRVVFVWQPHFDYMILNEESPDVVISQQAERFLIRVPNEIYGLTSKEIAEKKGF